MENKQYLLAFNNTWCTLINLQNSSATDLFPIVRNLNRSELGNEANLPKAITWIIFSKDMIISNHAFSHWLIFAVSDHLGDFKMHFTLCPRFMIPIWFLCISSESIFLNLFSYSLKRGWKYRWSLTYDYTWDQNLSHWAKLSLSETLWWILSGFPGCEECIREKQKTPQFYIVWEK